MESMPESTSRGGDSGRRARPRRRSRVVTILAYLGGTYGLLALAVFLFQSKLIFVGASWGRGQPVPQLPGVTTESLELPGVGRFRTAWAEPQGAARGVVLHFGGNGEDLRSGVQSAAMWAQYGLYALVVEYPGYGDSDGDASAETILAAARVAAEEASRRAKERDLRLFASGTSLGCAAAIHAASGDAKIEALVLNAPFTRLVDAARAHYAWLPVSWLLRHRFDNIGKAPKIDCPTLVLHGARDRVVSPEMGRVLAAAFVDGRFVEVPALGHMIRLDRGSSLGKTVANFLFGP